MYINQLFKHQKKYNEFQPNPFHFPHSCQIPRLIKKSVNSFYT